MAEYYRRMGRRVASQKLSTFRRISDSPTERGVKGCELCWSGDNSGRLHDRRPRKRHMGFLTAQVFSSPSPTMLRLTLELEYITNSPTRRLKDLTSKLPKWLRSRATWMASPCELLLLQKRELTTSSPNHSGARSRARRDVQISRTYVRPHTQRPHPATAEKSGGPLHIGGRL